MEHNLTPWTGDSFAPPGDHTTPPVRTPTSGRVRRWSFRIGRDGIAISSVVEDFGYDDHRPVRTVSTTLRRRSPAGLTAMTAVAGGLALVLVGATASRALSSAPTPIDRAMEVPMAKPVVSPTATTAAAAVTRAPQARRPVAGRAAPVAAVLAPAAAEPVPPAALTRAQAVERALGTGEFQEWRDRDGTTGFAVAGPAEPGAQGAQGDCRALAVLTRKIDGTDSVASSKVCASKSEAAPSPQ